MLPSLKQFLLFTLTLMVWKTACRLNEKDKKTLEQRLDGACSSGNFDQFLAGPAAKAALMADLSVAGQHKLAKRFEVCDVLFEDSEGCYFVYGLVYVAGPKPGKELSSCYEEVTREKENYFELAGTLKEAVEELENNQDLQLD